MKYINQLLNLIETTLWGYEKIAEQLLNNGAKINQRSIDGLTELNFTAAGGELT